MRPSLRRLLPLCAALVAASSVGVPGSVARVAAQEGAAAAFAGPIETAHGRAAWYAAKALEARLSLSFGGRPALAGSLLFRTNLAASRIELGDGTVAVFDGSSAWVSPASSRFERARFHLLTWPYFAALPMKLRDPGTHIELLGERPLRAKAYLAARLTFDPGTGDTPDDWYVLYRDRDSGRLVAAAYIVTYGTTASAAGKEPHAITYDDFVRLDGTQVATTWTFWHWSEERGITGEPIGSGKLTGLRFVQPGPGAFVRPPGAREDKLPKR
jgi:hypothetical protein